MKAEHAMLSLVSRCRQLRFVVGGARVTAKTFPGGRGLDACSEKPRRVCRVGKKVRMYREEMVRKRHQDQLGIEDP